MLQRSGCRHLSCENQWFWRSFTRENCSDFCAGVCRLYVIFVIMRF